MQLSHVGKELEHDVWWPPDLEVSREGDHEDDCTQSIAVMDDRENPRVVGATHSETATVTGIRSPAPTPLTLDR